MNYKTYLANHPVQLKLRGQKVKQFFWDPAGQAYQMNGQHLSGLELKMVLLAAKAPLKAKLEKNLGRLRQGNLTREQWRHGVENVCATRLDLERFIEIGGLDPGFKEQAEKVTDAGDQWRQLELEKDKAYLRSLHQEMESGRLGRSYEFGNLDARVLALLSDEIIKYSNWHVQEVGDMESDKSLCNALGKND